MSKKYSEAEIETMKNYVRRWRHLEKKRLLPKNRKKLLLEAGFSFHVPWMPFAKARKWARDSGLNTQSEWLNYARIGDGKPDDIPISPNIVYKKKGWKGWGDWLGTGVIHGKESACDSHSLHIYLSWGNVSKM